MGVYVCRREDGAGGSPSAECLLAPVTWGYIGIGAMFLGRMKLDSVCVWHLLMESDECVPQQIVSY